MKKLVSVLVMLVLCLSMLYVGITTASAEELALTESYSTKYVAGNRKTLYKEPNTSSEHFAIRYMQEIMIGQAISSSSDGSWVEVRYKGEDYYIWSAVGEDAFVDEKSTYTYVGDTQYAQEVVDFAKEISLEWDTVYTGGESQGIPDENGYRQFDCSGFVSYVLDNVMRKYIPLYDISSALQVMFYETDIVYNGGHRGEFRVKEIDPDSKRPGDVLFFDSNYDGVVDHCGFYLGNNEFVHSTTDFETGVLIALLDEARADTLVSVRRFTPEMVTQADEELCTVSAAKLYEEKSNQSQVIYQFAKNENVILHFTNNTGWSYVTINGIKGFVYTNNIGEDVFPDEPVISIALSDGKPKISWKTVENATKYSVYRSTSENGEYKCIITTTSLSYTDKSTSLEYGTPYYYKVKAVNDNGYSWYSNCVTTAPLDKPTISVALTSSGDPKISWNAVSGATKYSVYRSASSDGTYKLIKTTENLYYTDTSTALVDGNKYYYLVKASNSYGYSAKSYSASALLLGKAVISSSLSDGKPKISWKAVSGATKYSVYRSSSSDGTYTCISTVEGLSYTDTNTGLEKGKTYYYKVRAISASGYADYSAYAKAVPLDKPTISVALTSSGKPKISWNAVSGATKYSVYRSSSSDGTYRLIKTTENLYYTDTSTALIDGNRYYYLVKASNSYGYSAKSYSASALLLGKAVISSSLSDGKPKISWKTVSGATKYSIYRATDKTGEYKCIATVTTLSYVDKSTALENGKTYYYKVRARSDSTYANYSSYTAVTPLGKPAVSSALSNGSPKISWKAVTGATKYSVYRSTAKDGTYTCIKTVTGLNYTDTSSSLVKGKTYYYKVKAVNANGYSAYSTAVTAVPLGKATVSASLSNGNPKISWKAVSGATKYAVYRSASSDGTYKLIKTTENLYYTDTSTALIDGKNYYYKVKAVNSYGYSAVSSYAKVLVLDKASVSSSLSDGKPKISWKAVSGATKYSIYRASDKTGEYKCIATVTTLSYVDKSTALENGKTYYYKVRARSDGGYADYSGYTAVTPLAKPAVSSALSNGSPKISWKAVSGATKYAVYRSTSKDGTYKLIKTTTALNYTDTSSSLVNGKTYYYKVKAVNAKGYSASSSIVYKKVSR